MNIAGLYVLIVLVIGGVLDIWLGVTRGGEATISWTLLTWSHRYPVVAFGFGFLSGHIFAAMTSR